MRIKFGVANVFMNPKTGNYPTLPSNQQLITLQDFSMDIDVAVKELRGQFQWPDDTADADRKGTFKAGVGRSDIDLLNQVVFGEPSIGAGGYEINVNEVHTIPASSPFTITPTNAAMFAGDEGVIYQSGSAAQLGQKLLNNGAAYPSTGQYIYNSGSGVYTFAAADAGLQVKISYLSTVSTGRKLTVTNHTQGWGPGLEIYASNPYQELTAGIPNYVHLYACKITKTGEPLKRADYMIAPLEGEFFADASGNVADFYED